METLKFDVSKLGGSFKILNATNGGPIHKRHVKTQYRSNFEAYTAARIPFSRNHDSNICGSAYGGPYAHDISRLFPDFDADPADPASYDFACTDESILATLEAGTQTFFRLGESIEHHIKRHCTYPPADFQKWAVICEHVIRHYNEGWADGYHLNIPYWEIWNEADLHSDDGGYNPNWGGTNEQFYDFFEIAAKHLKSCFPHLKIGGPALAHKEEWADAFLAEMQKRHVPMDFFSWHIYCTEPQAIVDRADRIKALLVKNGYGDVESILNEWNYVKGWTDQFLYSIQTIHGIKGATFTLACMCASQSSSLDMLMYYDTRPAAFNGVFDYYTLKPLKGYYPFLWYGKFYDMVAEIRAENTIENIYSLCGVDANGKKLAVVAYYTDDDNAPDKEIALDFGMDGEYDVYLLDAAHDGDLMSTTNTLQFTMPLHSALLIREK